MPHFDLKINKTARVCTLGNVNSSKLLYVIHGYGQLATYFIEKFKDLEQEYYIVAPEGLHRFYLKGFYGRVGASWMTKEERLKDIEDYIEYLNSLHTMLSTENNYNEINILGFSQGVATMFRWLDNASFQPKHVIISSGMIPPDIDMSLTNIEWDRSNWTYITGDDDPFRNDEEVLAFKQQFKDSAIPLRELIFKGGHRIDMASVMKVLG